MAGSQYQIIVPEKVTKAFGWNEESVPRKALEVLVMELLRRGQVSEAEAAEILDLDRWGLLDLLSDYRIPLVDFTLEELNYMLLKCNGWPL